MDLNNTKDFTQIFNNYCQSISLSCHGCKIARLRGIRSGARDNSCRSWAENNKDKVTPILLEYWENEPFIPQIGQKYYFWARAGFVDDATFVGLLEDYALALMKNCFRSVNAAKNHEDEIMAKYVAIDNGVYPD